jgi:hypothetical protein
MGWVAPPVKVTSKGDVEQAAIKACRLDRESLLEVKPPKPTDSNNELNILVTTYHPDDNTIHDIVHDNWDILGKSLTQLPSIATDPSQPTEDPLT